MSIIVISRGTFGGGGLASAWPAAGYACLSRKRTLRWPHTVWRADGTAHPDGRGRPSFWTDYRRARRLPHFVRARCASEPGAAGSCTTLPRAAPPPGYLPVISVRVIADPEFRIQAAMRQQRLAARTPSRTSSGWTGSGGSGPDPVRCQLGRLSALHPGPEPEPHEPRGACDTVARLTQQTEFHPTAVSRKAMEDLVLRNEWQRRWPRFPHQGADLQISADDGIVTIAARLAGRRWQRLPLWWRAGSRA